MQNGRIKILSDIIPTGNIEQDKKLIPRIISTTIGLHNQNVEVMKQLNEWFYNDSHNILFKTKTQQPEINNFVTVPYPNLAVTTINAYCFANPFSFSSRVVEQQHKIEELNAAMKDDGYGDKLLDVTLNSGKCGLGYKYIIPADEEEIARGIYFVSRGDIDPTSTYCVYANTLKQEKICAINFYDKKTYDDNGMITGSNKVYTVWTKWHQWEFIYDGGDYIPTVYTINDVQVEAYPLAYGRIPIIEYPRKQDRTNDFEVALPLIDANNKLSSSRLDDVQQAVDYILLLRDIDTDTAEAVESIKKHIKDGLLSFKSVQQSTVQPEVKKLETKIDQSAVQTLQNFLCQKIEEALNIPNREAQSTGGDNGVAVEARNGTRSLENIAGLISACAKKAEYEALDVILAICNNIESCPFKGLTVRDVIIKDNRNKVENLINASNAYATLRNAGLNDATALEVTKLVSDPVAVSNLNIKEQEDKQQRSIQAEVNRQTAMNSVVKPTTTEETVGITSGTNDSE